MCRQPALFFAAVGCVQLCFLIYLSSALLRLGLPELRFSSDWDSLLVIIDVSTSDSCRFNILEP